MIGIDGVTPNQNVRLYLEANKYLGVFPLLEEVIGKVIGGRFRFTSILAIGGHNFVFTAYDLLTKQTVVVKQPSFNYCDPIKYSYADVMRARQSLKKEYDILRSYEISWLPKPIDLIVATSFVQAAQKSHVLTQNEVYLVEEYISGPTLNQIAHGNLPSVVNINKEDVARIIVRDFRKFWRDLVKNELFYGDINAGNFIFEETSGQLRVLDAGSIVEAGENIHLPTFTPAFTTPNLYQNLIINKPVGGSEGSVLPLIGKLLHFVLTKQTPLNGEFPNMETPLLKMYSAECQNVISAMLKLDSNPRDLRNLNEILTLWDKREN